MIKSFPCLECDHEIESVLVSGEFGDDWDYPEACPNCGACTTDGLEPSEREDFHSDI